MCFNTLIILCLLYTVFLLSPVHSNMLQCILCRRLFHVGKFPLPCSVRLTKGLISFLYIKVCLSVSCFVLIVSYRDQKRFFLGKSLP